MRRKNGVGKGKGGRSVPNSYVEVSIHFSQILIHLFIKVQIQGIQNIQYHTYHDRTLIFFECVINYSIDKQDLLLL